MSVIRIRSALGNPSKFPWLHGSTKITLPPASIIMLACRMGVILTTPALVLNSSTGREPCASSAIPISPRVFLIIEIVSSGLPNRDRKGDGASKRHLVNRYYRKREQKNHRREIGRASCRERV